MAWISFKGDTMSKSLLSFKVAGSLFAIDVKNTVEVVNMGDITPAPGSDPHVVGMMSMRGEIVSIIDFGHYLTGSPSVDNSKGKIILLSKGGVRVGVLIDDIGMIIDMKDKALELNPLAEYAGNSKVSHVLQEGSDLIQQVILDPLFSDMDEAA